MATTIASYRSRQHELTVKARFHRVDRSAMTASEVARTLRELIAMGLVEKIRDSEGVTRYRLTDQSLEGL